MVHTELVAGELVVIALLQDFQLQQEPIRYKLVLAVWLVQGLVVLGQMENLPFFRQSLLLAVVVEVWAVRLEQQGQLVEVVVEDNGVLQQEVLVIHHLKPHPRVMLVGLVVRQKLAAVGEQEQLEPMALELTLPPEGLEGMVVLDFHHL